MILKSKNKVKGSPEWTLKWSLNRNESPIVTVEHVNPDTGKTECYKFRYKRIVSGLRSIEVKERTRKDAEIMVQRGCRDTSTIEISKMEVKELSHLQACLDNGTIIKELKRLYPNSATEMILNVKEFIEWHIWHILIPIIPVSIVACIVGCIIFYNYGTWGDRKISRSEAKSLIVDYIKKDYETFTVYDIKVKDVYYFKETNTYVLYVQGYYKPYGDYIEIGGRELRTVPEDIHDRWQIDAKTGECGWG